MRCLLIASLLAGLAAAHVNPNGPVKLRKSLGFGPINPNAAYYSNPYQITTNGFLPHNEDADPMDVAQAFIEDVLRGQLSQSMTFKIRPDSYTDSQTGITHVYVRQMVNGLEVADANMNINIKDGRVLSYGNSFFRGTTPSMMGNPWVAASRHPHREYCEDLTEELVKHHSSFAQSVGDQVPMGNDRVAEYQRHAAPLVHLHESYCQYHELPYEMAESKPSADSADLRPALLQFMIAATPNTEVADGILGKYDEHLEKMTVSSSPHFAPTDAINHMFVDNVPDTVNPVKAHLAYVQVPAKMVKPLSSTLSGRLVFTLFLILKLLANHYRQFEVEMQDNWYEASVSAVAPHRIISVVDWASDSAPIPPPETPKAPATYNVFPWGINDPQDGERSIMKENFDSLASPIGWHSLPYENDPSWNGLKPKGEFYRNTTTTWGNNVFAQENWEGQNSYLTNLRPEADKDMAFDFKYKPKDTDKGDAKDEAYSYINATVSQLFYTSNLVHDLYYRYGFDEVAGNFQQHNFDRGGREGDAVIANAQDGSGFNNANFMTPPDGQNGRMRMYLWNTAIPYRDGDFEAGIVIHELSHGLSTRLTGGPLNSGCLGWGESGGMGEGWGDFLATTIRSTKKYSDYPMGAWAANRETGIRNYPYSLNDTINPSTYKTLDKPGYWGVHAIGEVWAEMLWIVSQRLIAEHGFREDLFPPLPLENGTVPEGDFYRPSTVIPKHGNTLSVQLVLNGMKLQPCQPSFFDARDAIILADEQLTGGENFCTLWKAFSERGLGTDATIIGRTPWGGGVRTDGFAAPAKC
ncbi:hypothetical protein D9758_011045 [Tetrapyrgos nigripes]|uniref:Extracellular metalloproteinase n=1 Tax=Tetrapyrgos nigripes TaxID=182062 RepID=A0A8H5CUB9_9AGAR|nr:hypothetical protein D9758_011045 [Tetrapyrgos nigripes]